MPKKGWFPAVFCKAASPSVMQNVLKLAAITEINLAPPATWKACQEGILAAPSHTNEYREVDRIQSSELWKTYAVKTEATKARTRASSGPKILAGGFNRA
eukprot:scaffold6655_cov169-Amphora_coffeaeformis.AAC.28